MTFVYFLAIMALVFVSSALILAFWSRHRGGRWRSVPLSGSDVTGFETSLCRFTINRRQQRLVIHYKNGGKRTIPLGEIQRVVWRTTERHDLWLEFLTGFDLTDLFHQYRDLVESHTLALKLDDGEEVPIYRVEQLHQREFLMTWFIELQESILARFGLYQKAGERTREVADRLVSALRWAKCEVVLAAH